MTPTSPPSKEVALDDELAAINALRLELGHITDGDGAPIDDEAVIFFVGDEDMASEIKVSTPNALHVATRLVELWNAAAIRSVQPPAGEGVREAALASAAQDFVDKVERGEARSKQSYAAFKAALALPPVSGDGRK